MQLTASPVKQLALAYNIPVLQPTTLKTEAAQHELAVLDADVMVVAAYGLILPKTVLELPRYGCFNIHASLLPRWRGAAPIQRAIQAGDTETGITIMQMDVGLDTGDMLLRQTCPIAANDNATTLHDKLAEMGANNILQALCLLQTQQLQPVKQNEADACYAPKLLKIEAQIDWQQDARAIERTVRAFNPFPVCQSNLQGVAIKIWQARLSDRRGEPGTVLAVNKQSVTVACGKGALSLEVLQRAGGKAQPAAQFLQSTPISVGDQFTQS